MSGTLTIGIGHDHRATTLCGIFGIKRPEGREVIAVSGSLNQRLAGSDPLEVKWTSGKGEALRTDEGWSFHPR